MRKGVCLAHFIAMESADDYRDFLELEVSGFLLVGLILLEVGAFDFSASALSGIFPFFSTSMLFFCTILLSSGFDLAKKSIAGLVPIRIRAQLI